jgi:hypothetical protein
MTAPTPRRLVPATATGERRLTDAQTRALRALVTAGPSTGGHLAVVAGYRGKAGSPYGGAGRAPMWWGRVMARMPIGLVRVYWDGPSQRFEITDAGRLEIEPAQEAGE